MPLSDWSMEEIVEGIKENNLPSEAIVSAKCWKIICGVRGKNLGRIDPEEWRELCERRGYLHSRHNSRGF